MKLDVMEIASVMDNLNHLRTERKIIIGEEAFSQSTQIPTGMMECKFRGLIDIEGGNGPF